MDEDYVEIKSDNGKRIIGYAQKEFIEAERKLFEKYEKKFIRHLIFGKPELTKERNILKQLHFPKSNWAWIIVGKSRKMAWLTEDGQQAFKADGYSNSWYPWKRFTFDRWCTSFDL